MARPETPTEFVAARSEGPEQGCSVALSKSSFIASSY